MLLRGRFARLHVVIARTAGEGIDAGSGVEVGQFVVEQEAMVFETAIGVLVAGEDADTVRGFDGVGIGHHIAPLVGDDKVRRGLARCRFRVRADEGPLEPDLCGRAWCVHRAGCASEPQAAAERPAASRVVFGLVRSTDDPARSSNTPSQSIIAGRHLPRAGCSPLPRSRGGKTTRKSAVTTPSSNATRAAMPIWMTAECAALYAKGVAEGAEELGDES